MTLEMEEVLVTRFVPPLDAHCFLCAEPYPIPDLNGLEFRRGDGSVVMRLVLCGSHWLDVTKALHDRYYPVWGLRLAHEEGPDDKVVYQIEVLGPDSYLVDRVLDEGSPLWQMADHIAATNEPGQYRLVLAKGEE